MNLAERREAELEMLCRKNKVTYQELACEFDVSRETIRKDIIALMCSYPIETVQGRNGGGVKVLPGFTLRPKTLNTAQIAFLESLKPRITADELSILTGILELFTP